MKLLPCTTVFLALGAFSFGQIQDAQPMDAAQVLAALKQLREQHDAGLKARKTQAYNQVMQAAANGSSAVAFWKEAVKATQFEGAENQGAKLADWRESDGEALNSKEGQTAARLHLYWLGLTLQHAMGTETKSMLPNIIEFTKQVRTQEEAMEKLNEHIDRAKDRRDRKDVGEDQAVKKVHDQIMRTAVGGSPVARWLKLGELLGEGGGKDRNSRGGGRGQQAQGAGWEFVPGNVDGIFNAIVLPEFRAAKDPRLLEYWDVKIKQETDRAAERKLDIEQREWTQERRPTLLWARAQDILILGQKNRALGEMFSLIKNNPQNTQVGTWISSLEALIMPPPAAPAPTPAPESSASVPAPVLVPAPTLPAAPATATTADPFRLTPKPAAQ